MKEVKHCAKDNNDYDYDKVLKYIKWFVIGIISLFIITIIIKFYLDSTYYQIKFSKGDFYYVEKDQWTINPDGKIEFKSLLWDRKVEGYNYRIKAPILGD